MLQDNRVFLLIHRDFPEPVQLLEILVTVPFSKLVVKALSSTSDVEVPIWFPFQLNKGLICQMSEESGTRPEVNDGSHL